MVRVLRWLCPIWAFRYSIIFTVGAESWLVFRRFRQLRELHKFAVSNVPGAKHLGFPKRRMLGNRDVRTPVPWTSLQAAY